MRKGQAKLTQIPSQCLKQKRILGGHSKPPVSGDPSLAAPFVAFISSVLVSLLITGQPLRT